MNIETYLQKEILKIIRQSVNISFLVHFFSVNVADIFFVLVGSTQGSVFHKHNVYKHIQGHSTAKVWLVPKDKNTVLSVSRKKISEIFPCGAFLLYVAD